MKRIILLFVLVSFVQLGYAQSGGSYRVELDPSAQSAISKQRVAEKKAGYTLCIFADNGQNARSEANAYLKDIKKLLPYEPSTMEYENPFFKVYVGQCYSRVEAVRLMGLLKDEFPRAVITLKEYDLQLFGNERFKPLHVYDAEIDDSVAFEAASYFEGEEIEL